MSVYYKYAPYGSKLVVLSYVDGFSHWYTSMEPVKWFLDTFGMILHVKFLGYSYWFMYIMIPQLREHSISVDQDRYATYFVTKYLDIVTKK